MRVTNNMMVNTMMHNLEKNLTRMSENQRHLSSGRRIMRASDDPIDASKVLRFQTDLSEIEQYDKNVRDALNWYQVVESSVAEVGEIMQRGRELAVKAANGVNTPDDLKKIAEEVHNLRRQLVSTGNANFTGKYIFSGYQTDKPLFNEDGTYNIDITATEYTKPPRMSLLVGTGETMQISTSGLNVFGMVDSKGAYDYMLTDSAGDQMIGNKSAIKGRLNLKESLDSQNLDIVFNGTTYSVNTTGLIGTESSPINKDVLVDRFKTAVGGGAPLADVAEVYYDDNDNLVIESKLEGNVTIATASPNFRTAKLFTGAVASKSFLSGTFALEGPNADYTTQNLDVTMSGLGTFDVPEVILNGEDFLLTKDKVVQAFADAPLTTDPTKKLSEFADIYFDQNDQLIIKDRRFGAETLTIAASPGFNPSMQAGSDTTEASVSFPRFGFHDDHIASNQGELKRLPIYVTYGGERKAVRLDPSVNIMTVADYHTALQNAVDASFGSGKINVTLNGAAPNQSLQFETVNTPDGIVPELRIEHIKTKRSSLLEDMDGFYNALMSGEQDAVQTFLGKVDAHLDRVIAQRADIGAKVSRMELIKNRIADNRVTFTGMLSESQDVDMAKEIMILKNAESIYQASLSTGSKVIQPTLVDFLR
ncbi:MAG: flagellar hook-associated protein 3 [Clostridiales bacterium]|nr:MAG: flagellar hook-associated protein 3 [Clostridiales bacterium]